MKDGRALSFGRVAGLYDRHRPRYPEEAVRWAVGERPSRVVDLGAGTGILSRVAASLGHQVIPVEPDDAMRAHLAAVSPGLGAAALAGTAEEIPLQDGSVDAVVAGQAYHWFDPERAHAEIARVLRPGGVFAPMWNHRDDSVPWVAELSVVTDDDTAGRDTPQPASFGPRFGRVESAAFHHTTTVTVEDVLALVHTRSYYIAGSEQYRARLDRDVHYLLGTHPDVAGKEVFELPYMTYAFRAEAVPGPRELRR